MPPTKRPNSTYQDKVIVPMDVVVAIAATTTIPLGTMDGAYRVEKFEIMVPAGVTQDPANFYSVTLQVGATVLATFSFQTGQQGTLAANTFGSGALAASPVGAKGDQIDAKFTKNGTAANIPVQSRVVVHAKQLDSV